MRRLGSLLAATAVAVLLATLGPVPSVQAAPAAPTGLAADPSTGPDNPVLRWQAPPGAVRYDVQVSPNADFSGTLTFAQATTNTVATMPKDLSDGSYYWRVRALDKSSVAGGFATASFVKTVRDAPVLTSPTSGQQLTYPDDALVLRWQPLDGAKQYEVQIDDDELFVGAASPVTTSNTSYAPLAPPVFGTTYWWRVRAKSNTNVYSQWSAPGSYVMNWGDEAVQLTSPPSTNTTTVEEVVLAWQALPGAAWYQVDLSPDGNFNNPIVNHRRVNATRFTLGTDLPAGAYYWRVRGMSTSTAAEPGPWSATWTFTRAWPGASVPPRALPVSGPGSNAQVSLTYPADADYGLDQPRFEWTPQRSASNYEVQFSSDANFSPQRVASCLTDHTRLTPFAAVVGASRTCAPVNQMGEHLIRPGVVTYWRVRALDGPGSPAINGEWTPGRSFLYDPGQVRQTSPVSGSTVSRALLTWDPLPNVAQYEVRLQGRGGDASCNSLTVRTYATAIVPQTLNPKCVAGWSWTVVAVEAAAAPSSGGMSRTPPLSSWWTFTWAPPATTPGTALALQTSQPSAFRAPTLSWSPVATATKYVALSSVHGAGSFTTLNPNGTNQTAYVHDGLGSLWAMPMSPGDYDVYVEAWAGSVLLQQSAVLTFHIDPMPLTEPTSPTNCPPASCTSVEHDTPTLRWNPVDGAGYYLVYLATDPNFTNITRRYATPFTSLTPSESLADGQAGQATYWFVRPCIRDGRCGPFDATVFDQARAFRKISVPATAVGPLDGATVTVGEVTFRWNDYLATNQAASPAADQEAAYYKVQVSTSPSFSTLLETSPAVDQTEYTSDLKTYPDGPLYWRVQPYDNTGNPLTSSPAVAFTKRLAPPVGLKTDGKDGAYPLVGSTPLLQWAPETYAQQYEVEVYSQPGSPLSPVNRVASIVTRSTAAIALSSLPSGDYGWRLRRVDAGSQPGSWSAEVNTALTTFRVGPPPPVLSLPRTGATETSSSLLLAWEAVPGASSYRVEASLTSSFATLLQSATSDPTRWAPSLLSPAWPNGTIYWRVTALDGSGRALSVSATGQFVRDVSSSGEFTAVTPYRVLDTRTTGGAIHADTARTVTVTGGASGIPSSGVSAVILNVTATAPTATSYLTLYPAGVTRPVVSSLNFVPRQTVASQATVPVDSRGRLSIYNHTGDVQVILDVVGYISDGTLPRGTRYTPATQPTRIADTRLPTSAPRPLRPREDRVFEVAGLGQVPAGATAAVLNITAVTPTAGSYLTVYPNGWARPTTSSVNFAVGQTVPNLVTMQLGTGGDIRIYNREGTTNVLVDVMGWYLGGDPAPGARLHTITPTRIADTRAAQGPVLAARVPRSFQVRGVGGIPSSTQVTGAVLTVTVTAPAGSGYATVYPGGTVLPNSSNLNFTRGQTVATQVVSRVGDDGKVTVYVSQQAHVVIDTVGWLG